MLTRFAPSPTGYLHLGHALAAREAFGAGPCLLRIEDIDHTRCKPEYARAIRDDLRWLGFDWPEPMRVQSEHLGEYAAVLDRLKAMGVVYPCALSRKEVAARSVDGIFRGTVSEGDTPAWRLSVPAARAVTGPLSYIDNGSEVDVDFDAVSDDVLARHDIGTSYHLAVTHDDALQGITHVIRGADLRATTPLHRVLQALMDWPVPSYRHHRLITDGHGKLSKRRGSATLRSLREGGASPAEICAAIDVAHGKP